MNQPISESLKSFTNIRLSSGAVGRGLVVLLVADGLLLLFFGQPLVMDAALLPLWLGGLFSFVLADFGSKLRERLLLTGYLNFLYLLSWFTLGTLPTLALILIGVSLAALLRVGWGPRLGLGKVSKTFAWRLALLQAAWFSGALLVVAAVYHLLGGTLPLDSHELVATAAALLAAFGVPQVLALWLAGDSGLAPVWKAPRAVFFLEIFLLVLAPALALTLPSAGTLFVVIVLTLLGVQALRDIQMLDMRWQLTQRVEQLSLLAQMAQQVTTTLVLDDLLLSIYHEVQRLLPSTRFMAALYDEETQTLDFPLTMVNGQRVERVTRPLADTPTDYVVHSGRSLYLRADNDVLRQKLHIALPPPGENRSVYLGVPLLAGDRTIGALALEHDDDPNALDTHAQMVLEMVAGQVGVAIRNALLYERSTKMTNALALMNTSVQHIMFNLDSAKGLETACATAMAVSGAQKSAIYVLDMAHKTRMRLAQQHNLPAAYVQAFAEQPYEPEHYAAGAYVVPDTREDARMAEAGRLGQFQASAQIPLRSSSALVGCLIVYYERVHYFQQHELDLLKTLSYQITAALDNAELLKALEIYASEQAQLVYLSRMSTASLELDKVLAGVAALLEQMVSIDHVRVAVLVAGRERLQLFDTGGSRLNVRNLALHALPEVQALFSGAQPLLPQIFQHSAGVTSPELRALMQENGESTLALVPLTVNGNVLGAMLLGSRTPREFSDSEIRLIEMAMNQVAAQIYNARLFATTEEDLKRRMEQLSLLEDIAQEITGALDLNKLISFVLQAAISATQADVATLGLLTEGERFWFIVRERSADGQWQEHYQTSMAQNGISGRVAHTGQTALVVDNQLDPDYIVPSKTRVYRSSLVVPLRKEERVMGVLNVESEEINFFTPQQSSFLNNLAGHAVISIDNARLLQERQREIETLQRLRELALRMSNAHEIGEVATAILQTSFSMLNAQDAALFSYNALNDEMLLLSGRRYNPARKLELEETLIRGKLAYQIIKEGGLTVMADLREYPPYEYVDTRDYITLIGVPIKRNRRISEVLCLGFTAMQHLEESELGALDLLSIQAAGHLENAMLSEQIRSSSNRTRAILDSTRDGVILLDRRGLLIDYNPSAERLLGISLEERTNRRFAETLISQAQAGELGEGGYSQTEVADLARILQEEPERITRRQFARFVHEQFTYIEEIGSPVTDSDHQIIGRLLVLRDITEEKQLESYRDEVTHMIVHDLRGPLGSIISALTLAKESVQDPDTMYMVGTTLDVSLTSAYKLLLLVDSMLDVAKLEQRKMPLKFAPASVEAIAQDAFISMRISAQTANINVRFDIPGDVPAVLVDSEKIQRVLTNLIDNAIKYTPSGGTILLRARQPENRNKVLVQVMDSGPGVPHDERERIFDKFISQVKGKGPIRGAKGNGLGLTFCKLTIEAHGENIWVDNDSDLGGACFSFTLPIVPDAPPEDTFSLSSAELLNTSSVQD